MHQPMTLVRACQTASELLRRNRDKADCMHGVLRDEDERNSYAMAILTLRDFAARVAIGNVPVRR